MACLVGSFLRDFITKRPLHKGLIIAHQLRKP
jgi:hypothetical protein